MRTYLRVIPFTFPDSIHVRTHQIIIILLPPGILASNLSSSYVLGRKLPQYFAFSFNYKLVLSYKQLIITAATRHRGKCFLN